jgi:hypothetical protein
MSIDQRERCFEFDAVSLMKAAVWLIMLRTESSASSIDEPLSIASEVRS